MKCPHCLVAFSPKWEADIRLFDIREGAKKHFAWDGRITDCPECHCRSIWIAKVDKHFSGGKETGEFVLVYPRSGRTPLGPEVPSTHAENYREACWVLSDSPKASAALSRRTLQLLLRDVAKVKPSDLGKEIDEVLASNALPSHLARAIDAVRQLGNFAAHPIKSTNTGEIVDVEPGEAEWLLDAIEGLFDFYFVQPAILEKKREELDKKLAEAGKPPLKG
jgi:hypothetical protein